MKQGREGREGGEGRGKRGREGREAGGSEAERLRGRGTTFNLYIPQSNFPGVWKASSAALGNTCTLSRWMLRV